MKVLKMIGLVLAKIALVVTVLLFMFSLATSYVLENGISSLLVSGLPNVGESVQHRVEYDVQQVNDVDLNEVYNEVLNKLGITEEQLMIILESPIVKELVNEFVDTVLEDIATGEVSDFDLGEKVMNFVENNKSEIEELLGQPVPMDKIEKFAESEEVERINAQYKEAMTKVSDNVPKPVKGAVKGVGKFISVDFRGICLIVIAVLMVIIALLQESLYKWIRTLGNTILGCGIFVFIINLLGSVFASVITSMVNLNGTLEFGKALVSSAVSIGIGVALLIVYMIIKKFANKGVDNSEISQNAS